MNRGTQPPTGAPECPPSRRQILGALGASGVGFLAGCLGDDSTGNGSTPTTESPDDQPDPTPTATETATDAPADRPTTGERPPELAVFDEAMLSYMDDKAIPTGLLGVAKDGDVVLQRGYGWADSARTGPVSPTALCRIASISKFVTDAAVLKLGRDGELSADTKVLPLLSVDPPGRELADERFRDVTVEHLLRHRGGWDSQQLGYDPMYVPVRVATELGLDGPPSKYDTARHMLARPMQFDPGARKAYSNFGYSLLGQVIEGITGMDYQAYLAAEILGPAGIDGITLGSTRPEHRPPGEVWYESPADCPNAFTLDESREYSCADAGFLVSEFDSAGGHVASTGSLLAYLDAYWLTGQPRDDRSPGLRAFGSHPGSYAIARQYPNGVDAVALFNSRSPPLEGMREIESKLSAAVEAVKPWG